jgi:hypothetical protein
MSQKPKDKLGATPGKLALVAVLALVLIGVVASNFSSGGKPPRNKRAKDETLAAADAGPAAMSDKPTIDATSTSPFGKFAEDGNWPEFPMSEITSFDPMAKAAWAKPVVAGEEAVVSDAQINELLAAKNAIIFMAGDKRVARIGENEYHVGDVIGRYQISDITARGVVLSEAQ